MSETNNNTNENALSHLYLEPKRLFGRKQIFTDETEITSENINAVVEQAYLEHLVNREDINYLYKFYKGDQPVLYKVKTIRPEINRKVVTNIANEIVAFKVGYTVGKPVQYIASVAGDDVSKAVALLNDMMRVEGKVTKDRELVEWQMVCGTGYRLVLPKKRKGERVPFEFYTMNPCNTFVVYANDYTRKPLVAVSVREDKNYNVTFTAYTEEGFYTIKKGSGTFTRVPNPLNMIPIIEYPANTARLGAFETVLTLLNAVNEVDSNRLDSIEQFVQSLLVVYNAEFDEGVTANEIRQSGMVQLKSTSENKADLKVISEALDQTNTETLKKSLINMIHEIVGMPSQGDGSTGDSSNGVAVVLKNGWQGAETRAEDYEAMFNEPERKFLSIVSFICDSQGSVVFDPYDIDVKFTRRNYEALLQKSQTLTTLLASDWVHPRNAYEASGLFVDSEEAYQMGASFHEEQKKEAMENAETFTSGRTESNSDGDTADTDSNE